jgi:hypothetical protein
LGLRLCQRACKYEREHYSGHLCKAMLSTQLAHSDVCASGTSRLGSSPRNQITAWTASVLPAYLPTWHMDCICAPCLPTHLAHGAERLVLAGRPAPGHPGPHGGTGPVVKQLLRPIQHRQSG